MKKILAMVLALCLLAPCAFAQEIDLSGMSLAELTELRQRVQLAMFETDEWQEVMVPQGVWKVGEDIPEGTWTVKCSAGQYYIIISWGERLKENGEDIDGSGRTRNSIVNYVHNPEKNLYKIGDPTEYTFTVKNGDYISIEIGAAIFTPFHGKPDLGFK